MISTALKSYQPFYLVPFRVMEAVRILTEKAGISDIEYLVFFVASLLY